MIMRKAELLSIISFFMNFVCVLSIVILSMFNRIIYAYIIIIILLIILFFEFVYYKKLSNEIKFRFSCIYFLFSIVFAILISTVIYLYIKTSISVEYQSYKYFQLSMFPYAYCYPVFIFPSFYTSVKYSKKSLVLKRVLWVFGYAFFIILPMMFQINID